LSANSDDEVRESSQHWDWGIKSQVFLISTFRGVLYVADFLLGNYPASGFYMPTFRNTLPVPSS